MTASRLALLRRWSIFLFTMAALALIAIGPRPARAGIVWGDLPNGGGGGGPLPPWCHGMVIAAAHGGGNPSLLAQCAIEPSL